LYRFAAPLLDCLTALGERFFGTLKAYQNTPTAKRPAFHVGKPTRYCSGPAQPPVFLLGVLLDRILNGSGRNLESF